MSDNKEFDIMLNQFHEYLLTVLNVYRDLIPTLKSELEAVQKDDITSLNDSLKKQQALMLKTKSFDSKVSGFQSKLGISANTLTETISKLPEEHQLSFFEILSQFGQTSEEVKFYQEKCRIMLQSKLYLIDKALSRAHVQKDPTTYNKDAGEVQGLLFSKSLEVKI